MTECLGKNNFLHHRPVADAKGGTGFPLAFIHSLDTGADQFRLVGAGVKGKGKQTDDVGIGCHPGAGYALKQDRDTKEEEQNLQQHRSSAKQFNVNIGNEIKDFGVRQLCGSQQDAAEAADGNRSEG